MCVCCCLSLRYHRVLSTQPRIHPKKAHLARGEEVVGKEKVRSQFETRIVVEKVHVEALARRHNTAKMIPSVINVVYNDAFVALGFPPHCGHILDSEERTVSLVAPKRHQQHRAARLRVPLAFRFPRDGCPSLHLWECELERFRLFPCEDVKTESPAALVPVPARLKEPVVYVSLADVPREVPPRGALVEVGLQALVPVLHVGALGQGFDLWWIFEDLGFDVSGFRGLGLWILDQEPR